MTNIHTVPSLKYRLELKGAEDLEGVPMQRLMQLKAQIDDDLTALFANLLMLNATLDTQLVTLDGFPRQDIDVASIRATRANIRRLQNDYAWVMDAIHRGLATMQG